MWTGAQPSRAPRVLSTHRLTEPTQPCNPTGGHAPQRKRRMTSESHVGDDRGQQRSDPLVDTEGVLLYCEPCGRRFDVTPGRFASHCPHCAGPLVEHPARTFADEDGWVTVACGAGPDGFGCGRGFTIRATLKQLPMCPICGKRLGRIPFGVVPARLQPLRMLTAVRGVRCSQCGRHIRAATDVMRRGRPTRYCSTRCRQRDYRTRKRNFVTRSDHGA